MISLPIETGRLRIRYLAEADLAPYLMFMLDEGSTQFLAFEAADKTHAGAEALFRFILESYATNVPVFAFAIEDIATGAYVGSCGFAPYEEGVVECYYCVDAGHRGRGIAVEATRALLSALAAVAEVRAYCHPDNLAAHAVAEHCGMVRQADGKNKNTGLEGHVYIQRRS